MYTLLKSNLIYNSAKKSWVTSHNIYVNHNYLSAGSSWSYWSLNPIQLLRGKWRLSISIGFEGSQPAKDSSFACVQSCYNRNIRYCLILSAPPEDGPLFVYTWKLAVVNTTVYMCIYVCVSVFPSVCVHRLYMHSSEMLSSQVRLFSCTLWCNWNPAVFHDGLLCFYSNQYFSVFFSGRLKNKDERQKSSTKKAGQLRKKSIWFFSIYI